MTELTNNLQNNERVLLVCVDTGEYDVKVSFEELEELTETAGGKVCAKVVQKRPSPDVAYCIGKGTLLNTAQLCEKEDIDLVIFDRELTATQIRNIEDILDRKVIDRTMLILDIFAQRATTHEGRLQVEIAQNKYLLPRLSGMRKNLSRLGGGIGTRGPGETKLETDRRHIRARIKKLSDELESIEKRRMLFRKKRKKDGTLTVAVVGYTNVGKSTLMNTLTNAGVLAENKLFATLETTSRSVLLPDGRQIILVDTVGLIRRLPHQLVEAFKSTLEEASDADLILHVCDASSDECEDEAKVTRELLKEIGCEGIPVVTVLNKCDKVPYIDNLILDECDNAVKISAKTGEGTDRLLTAISKALPLDSVRCRLFVPFDEGALLNEIRKDGVVFSQDYTENGIIADVLCNNRIYDKCKEFTVQ